MITDHAYKRLKERLGWSKKTSNRMVAKIWNEGNRQHNGSRTEILHGNFSFCFFENSLVTVTNTKTGKMAGYNFKKKDINDDHKKRRLKRKITRQRRFGNTFE